MAYLVELLVGVVKTIVHAVRGPRRELRRHRYMDEPIHVCYWCGRFDPLEQELTNPPCVPTRKVRQRDPGIGAAHRKTRLQ